MEFFNCGRGFRRCGKGYQLRSIKCWLKACQEGFRLLLKPKETTSSTNIHHISPVLQKSKSYYNGVPVFKLSYLCNPWSKSHDLCMVCTLFMLQAIGVYHITYSKSCLHVELFIPFVILVTLPHILIYIHQLILWCVHTCTVYASAPLETKLEVLQYV